MALKATDIEIMVAAEKLHAEGRLSIANLRESVRGGSSERLRACINAVRKAAEAHAITPPPTSDKIAADDVAAKDSSYAAFTGKHCRVARHALAITTRELAAFAGLDRDTIEQYERGQRTPKQKTLYQLMKTLENMGIIFMEDGICWRLPDK